MAHRDVEEEALAILDRLGVRLNGHFVLAGGGHSDTYINKDFLYTRPAQTARLCHLLVPFLPEHNVVLGPACGGIILAYQLAQLRASMASMAERTSVVPIWSELAALNNGFVLRRGFDKLVANKRVLIVDDVLTTGTTLRHSVKAVKRAGGEVVGAAVLFNRGAVTGDELDLELVSLIHQPLQTWSAEECPLCERRMPVNRDVGHGRQFVDKQERLSRK